MLECTKCSAILDRETFNSGDFHPCSGCGSLVMAEIFPAAFRALPKGESGTSVMSDVEASCFYHPDKQAVTTCSNCGRFLCSLCDIELNNRHMCPACLESGKKKRRIKDLENHRFRYDKLVILLALLPILLWPFTLITAPLTVIIAIKYWNAPSSIIKKSRFRLILALILAGIQIVAWSFVIYKFLSMLL